MVAWSVGRALAHRNYRLFLVGQCISLIGTWMQSVAMSWLVYRLTNSSWLLGMVMFSTQLPSTLISPIAGVLIDRWNRHRSLLLTQSLAMLQALLLSALVYSQQIAIWQILVLGFVLGTINAFDMPLRQSFITEMVRTREDLANAIALNSSIFHGARLIGPSLAGLLLSVGGEGFCFLINGLSYFAVLAALLAMRGLPQREKRPELSVLKGLKEGLTYAFGFAPIRSLLLLLSVVSIMVMPLQVLMPVVATQILRGGPQTLGFLLGASGAGALTGALYLASRSSVLGLGMHIVIATGTLGSGMIALSFSQNLAVSMGLLYLTGGSMMLQMASCNTILQTIVDEDKRGRVMSLYTLAFLGTAPLGSLTAGYLAERFGVPFTFRLAGGVCICAGLLFLRRLPQLRKLIRPIYEQAGILPAQPAPSVSTTETQ